MSDPDNLKERLESIAAELLSIAQVLGEVPYNTKTTKELAAVFPALRIVGASPNSGDEGLGSEDS